jgi:hypothetical protein
MDLQLSKYVVEDYNPGRQIVDDLNLEIDAKQAESHPSQQSDHI